jgi:Uma2 family endonuclease
VSRLDDEFPQDRKEDPVSTAYELEPHAPWGWTTDDLDAMPEDNRRRELIDGALILSPSPTPFHQSLAGNIYYLLQQHCPDNLAVTQAVDVRINELRSLTPDVLVVAAGAEARSSGRFVASEVALAVEIVSPSSMTMDRITKPALYAEAGIPFYWCVDTVGMVVVNTYQLSDVAGGYQPTGKFTDVIEVDGPWRIRLPIADIVPRQFRRGS